MHVHIIVDADEHSGIGDSVEVGVEDGDCMAAKLCKRIPCSESDIRNCEGKVRGGKDICGSDRRIVGARQWPEFTGEEEGKGRPREAPYVWCPRKSQNLPSNPQAQSPHIWKRLSCDYSKRKYFGLCSFLVHLRFCTFWARIAGAKSDKTV